MNLYAKYIFPRLIDLVMRSKADTAERAKFVPPSHDLWRLARRRVKNAPGGGRTENLR